MGWTNTYNQIGQITSIYTSDLYKSGGNPVPGYLVQNVLYNPLGEPVSDTLGTGESESWTYNVRGLANKYSVGTGPTYGWNATYGTGVLSASGDTVNGNWTYTYDGIARLATSGNGTNAFSYGYDQYGNRWTQKVTAGSGPQPSYSFSANNQISGGVTYDGAGNMTFDGTYYYTYDGNNRVIAIGTSIGSNNVAAYVYNSRGQRVSTSVNGGAAVEWMSDLAGNLVEPIVPGTANDYWFEFFALGRDWGTKANGTTNYRFADWNNHGRYWETVAGANVQTCKYLPFGDASTCTNPTFAESLFGGNLYDIASNTNHTPNREYTPTQGRWLTPDPAGLAVMDVSNPQTWNRYAYVANNPLSYTDPLGLNRCGPSCGCNFDEMDCGSSGGSPSSPGGDNSGGVNIVGGPGFVNFSQSYDVYGYVVTGDGPDQWRQFATVTFDEGAGWIGGGTSDNNAANNGSFTKEVLPEGPYTNVCKSGQATFLAPASFDMSAIVAAGKAGGTFGASAALAAVGHGGTFDFQRSSNSAGDTAFYSGYTNVANFAVGAYLYGAGYTQLGASTVSNAFALVNSSNAGDPNQALYRNAGYNAAASGGQITCSKLIWAP